MWPRFPAFRLNNGESLRRQVSVVSLEICVVVVLGVLHSQRSGVGHASGSTSSFGTKSATPEGLVGEPSLNSEFVHANYHDGILFSTAK